MQETAGELSLHRSKTQALCAHGNFDSHRQKRSNKIHKTVTVQNLVAHKRNVQSTARAEQLYE